MVAVEGQEQQHSFPQLKGVVVEEQMDVQAEELSDGWQEF